MWPLSLLIKCSDAEGGPQNFVPVEGNWWQLHQRCYSCWKHQRYSSQVSVCTPRWPPENVLLVSMGNTCSGGHCGRHRQTSADIGRLWLHCGAWCHWHSGMSFDSHHSLADIAADIRRLRLHCGVWCWQDLWCDMMWPLSSLLKTLLIKCSDAEGGPQNFVPMEGNWWQLHQRCYSH